MEKNNQIILSVVAVILLIGVSSFAGVYAGIKSSQAVPTPAPTIDSPSLTILPEVLDELKRISEISPKFGANAFLATQFTTASTSKTVAVTSNNQLVGSSSPNTLTNFKRVYTIICNDSSQVVYLGLDGDKPMEKKVGIRLNANGGCYEINDQNLYTGAIRASSTNETSSDVIIQDYAL